MKKYTLNSLQNAIVYLILLTSSISYSQTVLNYASFESGMDGWTNNGSRAIRTNSPTRAWDGIFCIRTVSNGDDSSTDSPLFNFSTYDKIDIKIFFYSLGMETGDDFLIQYSDDAGSSWTTIQAYVAGDVAGKDADFPIGTPGYHHSKIATILKKDYTFPNSTDSQIRVVNDSNSTADYIYWDAITITGTTFNTPTEGPGGVTTNLDLWLRGDKIDGTTVAADGSNVSQWTDSGKGNHANTMITGQEPVYRNNPTQNFNFNPVIDFENDNNTSAGDMTYLTSRDELTGTSGFNSNDIFMVVRPDPAITTSMIPMDTFTSRDPIQEIYQEDVTGFGFGSYTARFSGEYFTYAIGTTAGPDDGYGRADLSGTTNYDQISIINARHNTSDDDVEIYFNAEQIGTDTSDMPDFVSINDTRYWIGRSQYWNGSFDGRIAELITYDSRKTDGTAERRRIESYLALKYGITLGANGTTIDYVDSNGNVVWDASANTGYNYDIGGIFRDDASNHLQKQSKSVNETSDATGLLTGIITMGLTNIADTNDANTGSFSGDSQYLVWGNNGTPITAAPFTVNVDMSSGIGGLSTPVTFEGMRRIWKVVETGGDVPSVEVSIPQDAIRNISPPGSFLMFISSTTVFDPTADYVVLKNDGSGNLQGNYDFDGTKYITFGYAPQVIAERSIQFDGVQDYIDVGDHKDLNPTEFTVSAWIKRINDSRGVSILSKRDGFYSEGYDFGIANNRRLEMSWNAGFESITSSIRIPEDTWHHVAVIFDNGTANLYIDGALDATETGLANPTATTQSFIIAAAGKTSTTDFFEGNIDEVRIWDVALTEDQLRYIMNQEIEENAAFVDGMVVPTTITKNDISTIPWTDLAGYYPMSIYTYTNTNDHSDRDNQGALRNLNTVDFQTAPLPYESVANTNWDLNSTWLNGAVQTIPGGPSIVDGDITVDWNIVKISHNITMDNSSLPAVNAENRRVLSLESTANELTLTDFGLTVTHYLKLDGEIDLEGEAQLIQTTGSDLDVTSSGSIERDQQGTADTYTYNYWSSPVSTRNTTTNNQDYTIPSMISDGTNPNAPGTINFLTTGFDGTNGSPIGLADYWLWKFVNGPGTDTNNADYAYWQQVRSTGSMQVGEGFTMKGPGTGAITAPQNYIFDGKPNNGDISVNITSGHDYLVGNPYPSAIDAHEFLDDNPLTGGTLYFWEHWGGGSHNLGDYQGGYAMYNYSGGTGAGSFGTNDPDVGTGGTPTKLPGRYVPVAQGFFVTANTTGTVNFENDQRVFVKEGGSSTFVRTNQDGTTTQTEDTRMKFRIGFNSVNQIYRQLLLTVDSNATANIDWGYDGEINEQQMDDMYWMIEDGKYVIQGTNLVNYSTIAPVGIHTRDNGLNIISIDQLKNVPDDLDIYVYDKELDLHHNLRNSDYRVHLNAGEYLERFQIVFNDTPPLSVDDNELDEGFQIYYVTNDENLVIVNPNAVTVNSLEIFNILGQSLQSIDTISNELHTEIKIKNLSTGTYIVKLESLTV